MFPTRTIAGSRVAGWFAKSTDDVKKALGDPEKIVDLSDKKVYVYKDTKVVFSRTPVPM